MARQRKANTESQWRADEIWQTVTDGCETWLLIRLASQTNDRRPLPGNPLLHKPARLLGSGAFSLSVKLA